MSGYRVAQLDEIAAESAPEWAPIRHRLDVRAFGVNAWRGDAGDEVIERHSEGAGGHEELYFVHAGAATFAVGGEQVDAPTGTLVLVSDPEAERAAVATADGTVVLAAGGWVGRAFEPSAWEADALAPRAAT